MNEISLEDVISETLKFKESEIRIKDEKHLLEVLKQLESKGYTWSSKKKPTQYIPEPCSWIQLWKDKTLSYSMFK